MALVPLLAFSWAGRLGLAIVERFYLGAALAILCTALLLVWRRWAMNPLLVAVNLWLVLEAIAFGSGVEALRRLSASLEESAFFATMLVVALAFVAVSRRGLFARPLAPTHARRGSRVLLMLIGAGLVWSLVWRGDETVAAVLPAAIIFAVQQVWAARAA